MSEGPAIIQLILRQTHLTNSALGLEKIMECLVFQALNHSQ